MKKNNYKALLCAIVASLSVSNVYAADNIIQNKINQYHSTSLVENIENLYKSLGLYDYYLESTERAKEEREAKLKKQNPTIEEMIEFVCIKFDLTREQFAQIVAACICEGFAGPENQDRINESLNVASALINRIKNTKWNGYVKAWMHIQGRDVTLWDHFTAPNQFDVFNNIHFKEALNHTSGPLYETIIKFFYYVDNIDPDRMNPEFQNLRHNYCSYWASRSGAIKLIPPKGNDYFDPIEDYQRIATEDTYYYQNLLDIMESEKTLSR